MEKILIYIITLGLKPLYEKNISYYKIVKEFREKLPRQQNQAKNLSTEEIEKNPFLHESFKYITVVDTSKHKTSISEPEIDLFYNKIDNFNYSFMFFKKHYQAFSRNLRRFNPKAVNGNFDLIVIQSILKDDNSNPLKPFGIFVMYLKWKWKYTSKIYLLYRKKKNQTEKQKETSNA